MAYLELRSPGYTAGFAQLDGVTSPHTYSYVHFQSIANGNADANQNAYPHIQRDPYAITDLDAHVYTHL